MTNTGSKMGWSNGAEGWSIPADVVPGTMIEAVNPLAAAARQRQAILDLIASVTYEGDLYWPTDADLADRLADAESELARADMVDLLA